MKKFHWFFSELQHYKINKLLILIVFLDIWYWILAKKIKVRSFESVTAFGNAAVSAIVKFSRGTFFAELGFFLFKFFCVVQQRQLNVGITILSFFLFFRNKSWLKKIFFYDPLEAVNYCHTKSSILDSAGVLDLPLICMYIMFRYYNKNSD